MIALCPFSLCLPVNCFSICLRPTEHKGRKEATHVTGEITGLRLLLLALAGYEPWWLEGRCTYAPTNEQAKTRSLSRVMNILTYIVRHLTS